MRIAMIVVLVAGCGGADDGAPDFGGSGDLSAIADLAIPLPTIPSALALPESGQSLLLHAAAHGTQDYACMASSGTDGGVGYAFVFTAPDAVLSDEQLTVIGHHYAGPTWELTDGSKVVGMVSARSNAPEAGAIPWLLLTVTSNSGVGTLAHAKYVHRLATHGGVAPATGCDAGSLGTQVRIDYTADYYFWGTP
jgi:hypothetical protein